MTPPRDTATTVTVSGATSLYGTFGNTAANSVGLRGVSPLDG